MNPDSDQSILYAPEDPGAYLTRTRSHGPDGGYYAGQAKQIQRGLAGHAIPGGARLVDIIDDQMRRA